MQITVNHNTQSNMTYTFTIFIHPHAMGHVIGKRGSIINRIRRECNVIINNTPYSEHQKYHVKMVIEGESIDDIDQAIYQIDHQIAISNQWCRNNGVAY